MSPHEILRRYQEYPILHIREIQGVETLEEYQIKKIFDPIMSHSRVSIRACHNVGKTFSLSKVVLHIGSCFPGSKIITTAPSMHLVKKLLWSEIRAGYRKSKVPLGGKLLDGACEWQLSDDWFALGMSPQDDAEGDGGSQGSTSTFQGFHSSEGMVVIIFDEATGVKPKRWIQAEGMMTQPRVKWIAIGNPTDPSSDFAKTFKDPLWFNSHISCFDSPNLPANGFFTIEDVEREIAYLRTLSDAEVRRRLMSYKHVNHYLLTAEAVIGLAFRRGIDSPIFVGKMLGNFPDQDQFVFIPLSVVEAAQRRTYEPKETDDRYFGIDPARFGTDETIITRIDGWQVTEKMVIQKFDGEEIAGAFIKMVRDLPRRRNEILHIDGTGIGASALDFIRKARRDGNLPRNLRIVDVQFGRSCEDPEDDKLYANEKARMFDLLGKDMKKDLCLPNETIYQEELPGIRYKFDGKGRYIVESKDDFKKRTGLSSPDTSDSLALANLGRHGSDKIGRFEGGKATGGRSFVGSTRNGDQW